MTDYDSAHSVARNESGRQGESSNLLRAILADKRLHRTALSIAVLAWLVASGATEALYTPDVHQIAGDLGTKPDSVYKAIRRLTKWGYVQRVEQASKRLLVRLVWPKTKPAKRARRAKGA